MQIHEGMPLRNTDDGTVSFDRSPLRDILERVMDRLTTQKLKPFYESILDWIIDSKKTSTDGHTHPSERADPKKRFKELYPEAFWSTQVVVEVFCDFILPILPAIEKMNLREKEQTAQAVWREIQARLFRQLHSLTDGLDPDFITCLSGEKYESRSSKDYSVVIVPSECTLPLEMRFEENAQLDLYPTQVHAIRKQLNMVTDGALAVCKYGNGGQFHTIGLLSMERKNHYFRFVINNHMEWQFCVPSVKSQTDCRLRYHQGMFKLPLVDPSQGLSPTLLKMFGKDGEDTLAGIIRDIDKSKHGAVLLVSSRNVISLETERLVTEDIRGIQFQQPVKILPSLKHDSMLARITSIDGAIFLDDQGYCHAFGVILDGEAEPEEGNIGRGARFNCTRTYVRTFGSRYPQENLFAVVKSEDGMLDVFLHEAQNYLFA